MGWIKELLWAIGLVGVPVGVVTLAIVWWAMQKGHLNGTSDSKAIEAALKALNKKKKKKKKGEIVIESGDEEDKRDFFQKKWAKFGGGFYGVTAFYTYLVIETKEIIDLVINYGGFWAFVNQLSIPLLISMFVNAIMNFVAAMVWPIYWSNKMNTGRVWLWFVAAYAGYWVGMQVALIFQRRRAEADIAT